MSVFNEFQSISQTRYLAQSQTPTVLTVVGPYLSVGFFKHITNTQVDERKEQAIESVINLAVHP